jgi:hypothetical protein
VGAIPYRSLPAVQNYIVGNLCVWLHQRVYARALEVALNCSQSSIQGIGLGLYSTGCAVLVDSPVIENTGYVDDLVST